MYEGVHVIKLLVEKKILNEILYYSPQASEHKIFLQSDHCNTKSDPI
jgi:hypothetical protein